MGKSSGLMVAVRYQGRGNALRPATRRRTLAPVALYAAYGSNLDPAQMLVRCPHSPQRGTGWLEGWRLTFGGAALSTAAYGIAIWAMTVAPIALVAALRETSVLFAALFSMALLREPVLPARIAAACLVLAGVVLVRLR